jgi:membrane protease YdiL (CAAX protease family)
VRRQVGVSSLAFAAAHLSGPDFVPLAALGSVLGGTLLLSEGNLVSATLAHGLYNAVILLSIAADGP